MKLWFKTSDREPGTAHVAVEHKGVNGFAVLTLRGVLRAFGVMSVANARLRRFKKVRSIYRRR